MNILRKCFVPVICLAPLFHLPVGKFTRYNNMTLDCYAKAAKWNVCGRTCGKQLEHGSLFHWKEALSSGNALKMVMWHFYNYILDKYHNQKTFNLHYMPWISLTFAQSLNSENEKDYIFATPLKCLLYLNTKTCLPTTSCRWPISWWVYFN